MTLRISYCIKIIIILTLLNLSYFHSIYAQEMCKEEYRDLKVTYEISKIYPTTTLHHLLKVGYTPLLELYKLENLENTDTWIIRKKNEPEKKLKPERIDLTTATNTAFIYLNSSTVKEGDELEVGIKTTKIKDGQSICVMHKGYEEESISSVNVKNADRVTLKLTPGIVPKQKLSNGAEKTAGHLNANLDIPSFIPNYSIARFYIKSDSLFSTENKDVTTQAELKLGAERSIINSWYFPLNIENKIIGNQTFSNASYVGSIGSKTNMPWGWTKPVLNNCLIKSPASPEIELSAQYENRLKQDDNYSESHAKKDNFRAFGQISWNRIYLFSGEDSYTNDLSLEFLVKGWWLPYEKKKDGNKGDTFEYRLEVSLLIPIETWKISTDGKHIKRSFEDVPSKRIRIKYTRGANEANSFLHSSEFTFAAEVII
jgi:hypothetical protein